MGQAGPYTACALLARHGYGKGLETAVMALQGPETTKPQRGSRGALTPVGETGYAEVADRRFGSLPRLTRLSTYLSASAILDGETTRRTGLNLDRGGQPLDTQRIAGKREWHRVTGKCSPQQGGSVSHQNLCTTLVRRSYVSTVQSSPSVIRV